MFARPRNFGLPFRWPVTARELPSLNVECMLQFNFIMSGNLVMTIWLELSADAVTDCLLQKTSIFGWLLEWFNLGACLMAVFIVGCSVVQNSPIASSVNV